MLLQTLTATTLSKTVSLMVPAWIREMIRYEISFLPGMMTRRTSRSGSLLAIVVKAPENVG